MARFNSTEEVREYCERVALGDILRSQFHGVDLNPFSTYGARNDWQRGFDGKEGYSWQGSLEWDTIYQRGRWCGILLRLQLSH